LTRTGPGRIKGMPQHRSPAPLVPFRVIGIDADDGSEFIINSLFGFCLEQHITFTCSRPAT
jgi:hypothetical protein